MPYFVLTKNPTRLNIWRGQKSSPPFPDGSSVVKYQKRGTHLAGEVAAGTVPAL